MQKPINPSILNDVLSRLFIEGIEFQLNPEDKRMGLKQKLTTLKGSHILLAEDNSTNMEIITGLLEGSGIEIDTVENGLDAVNIFKSHPTKYELILMDVQMPLMDGYEATRIIKSINENIPVAALTANAMKEDIEKSKDAGMFEHINKPIDVERFYSILLKSIPQKTDIANYKDEEEVDIEFREFRSIDANKGLYHLNDNKKLYIKILNNFYEDYKELRLEELSDEKFFSIIHTIKGLSANIGATELYKISKELEEHKDSVSLEDFYKSLNDVLAQISRLSLPKGEQVSKLEISKEKKEELFTELARAVRSKVPKRYKEVLSRIDCYRLLGEDRVLYEKVKGLLEHYKFKDSLSLLEGK